MFDDFVVTCGLVLALCWDSFLLRCCLDHVVLFGLVWMNFCFESRREPYQLLGTYRSCPSPSSLSFRLTDIALQTQPCVHFLSRIVDADFCKAVVHQNMEFQARVEDVLQGIVKPSMFLVLATNLRTLRIWQSLFTRRRYVQVDDY